MNTRNHSPYITSTLTRGSVCHLQLLLVLASAFILWSVTRGTRDHILLSQIRDPFLSPPTTRRATVQVFDLASTQKYLILKSQSQSYVTTDGRSASLSWNKVPLLGLRPDFYYCQTVAGFLRWAALSDERTGLSFARFTVSSYMPVVSMYNFHFTCY
jgi:hypothetical protein